MTVQITDNTAESRFEVSVDGALAGFADYRLRAGTIVLTHTEVFPDFEGRGLGSRLVRHALDAARDAELTVRPDCPYVASYIQRHPEYQDLLLEAS
ncbi:GNAT family N-acetyltransferase [Thermoactinospora rubra]|uniref:GNAT family N-acetyltransferase n=1 Tax=Thermoactinospora rubra TaxID=1088767 RepID=UPI000A0FF720|nr:GNAT family N-acetyltransferase [Thermoactinospora rubra]